MQSDLNDYLIRYNTKRPHQGLDMKGRSPCAVFVKGLLKKEKKTVAKKAADAG